MIDTDFYVPPEKLDRFAACYRPERRRRAGGVRSAGEPTNYTRPPSAPSGGGGLVSTTGDYLPLLPDAAQQGRAGRRAAAGSQDGRVDDDQPPAAGRISTTTSGGTGFGLGVSVLLDAGTGPDARLGGRIWLGRRGQHQLLD